jgi:hypothetical protein
MMGNLNSEGVVPKPLDHGTHRRRLVWFRRWSDVDRTHCYFILQTHIYHACCNNFNHDHYVRKSLIHTRMKNRDAQIARLHRRISHYRVFRDACPDAYPISIHWRRAKLECVSHYMTHPRRALRVRISNLIGGWAPSALIRDAPGVCNNLIFIRK